MQTQSKVFIGLGLVILIIIGFSVSGGDKAPSNVSTTENNTVAEAEMTETNMDSEDTMDAHPDTETNVVMGDVLEEQLPEASSAPLVAGIYTEYTPEAVANSNAEHIVLNFSATWCPSCRTLDKNINENVTAIPDGVEIYKVDYDTNVELRKKYGITTQHSLVVVNPDGTMVKKWTGGNTLSGLVNQL